MDGLSKNPSFSEMDITRTRWHRETNLETIFGWHVVLFFYILANGYQEVCQVQVDSLGIHGNLEVELDDIWTCEHFWGSKQGVGCGIDIQGKGLGPSKVKIYCWEGQHLFRIWPYGHVLVVPCTEV